MPYTDRDINEWMSTASLMYGNVPTDETFGPANEAAASLISGSGLLGASDLFDHLITVGYSQALQDVRNGEYDEQVQEWRSLKYSEDE